MTKKIFIALEDGYFLNSTKYLVYKKGKHYPVLDEFDNQVMIIDEEGDRHWFEEVSYDPSYKVVTEEFLNQETSNEEKPLKQEKPHRPLENWIQTLSDYKFERCIKECNTIDYGMFWNGDTQCLYLYYNPMKGYTVSDKGFGIPTRVNLQGKPEIKKKVFDNISFQKAVQNALDNEILSLDADGGSLCKFEVPEDRSLFDELKEGLEECVEIKEDRDKSPVKSDGGDSKYYHIDVPQWFLDNINEKGYTTVEDLAEVIFKNDANFFNVFKAQCRMFDMTQGGGKEGNTFEYDATKSKYYVDKQVEVFNR